ncbi:hypothetical protein EIN_057220 [Entamoeba invadens IP1]|uniref:hypothetical protein n=1 Tax=Entamoeba invadens IP1 TaxID=370355 RepID=UPI0002C3FA5C|nr:hypothetical protein EIN_057220 [Entamoeba invadens IP1]ELP93337.1 hypothetical protein EIN_057220 [Entamoeba invadens IP1]|eukprot:XP_004260108.1 hypothetical protein EIN_057220 [Entamoeba invadens IP1]
MKNCKRGVKMLLFLSLLVLALSRSGIWGGLDYQGLRVRDWENGLEEARRREMPLMVIFLKSTTIDGAIRHVLSFNQDDSYMKRTKQFVVVVADDTDNVWKEYFGPSEEVQKDYPKILFFHYNGAKYDVSGERPTFNYEDSFELTDKMEEVLDMFEDGVIPEKKNTFPIEPEDTNKTEIEEEEPVREDENAPTPEEHERMHDEEMRKKEL